MELKKNLLLRKKYSCFIFEYCQKEIKNKINISKETENLEHELNYDAILAKEYLKINNQLKIINDKLNYFQTLNFIENKHIIEFNNFKKTFKKQKNEILNLQEKNFIEMKLIFDKITNELIENIYTKIKEEKSFLLLIKEIQETDQCFILSCQQFKLEKEKYYKNINNQTNLILENCTQIEKDINTINNHDNQINLTIEKSRIISKCKNLSYYVDNFINLYPETTNFKNGIILKLNLKQSFLDFNEFSFNGKIDNIKVLSINLNYIKKIILKTKIVFSIINNKNIEYLNQLEIERKKIIKLSINEPTLTNQTIFSWLENNEPILSHFSSYLKNHKFNLFFEKE